MIVDRLTHWPMYRGLGTAWQKAFEFLSGSDLQTLALGRHDLDGDRLFALVQEYTTKSPADCRWEAHQRYGDLQYVVSGTERIGVANLVDLRVEQAYDAERDVAFFVGDGDVVTLRAGSFAIFLPQDGHRPCMVAERPEAVRKIVFKVELSGGWG